MFAQLALAAGAAGWKAGHAAVRSGALALVDLDDAARDERLSAYAAEQARAYARQAASEHDITPAEGARLVMIYGRTFARGALDQALDGGALLQGS